MTRHWGLLVISYQGRLRDKIDWGLAREFVAVFLTTFMIGAVIFLAVFMVCTVAVQRDKEPQISEEHRGQRGDVGPAGPTGLP